MNTPAPSLTADTLASTLGVERKTVEQWARDSKIPGWQLPNGSWRFDMATVLAAMANRAARLMALPRRGGAA